jgi:hypothetical protein
MTMENPSRHDETWLLLPWLANGRLTGAQRAQAEEHVRECAACAQEVATQRDLCALLTEPERVTYAPGPSLRKLLERIDGGQLAQAPRPAARVRGAASAALASSWRPPGLAWAATFLLTLGLGVLLTVTYRWSQPLYNTVTSSEPAPRDVLHIAFDRSLPVGEVEEVLRSAGARVVEGPGTTGVFGVAPVALAREVPRGTVSPEMRTLAARLQADPRVRWIEPLALAPAADDAQGSRHSER